MPSRRCKVRKGYVLKALPEPAACTDLALLSEERHVLAYRGGAGETVGLFEQLLFFLLC